jgi:hypothetical protein
MKYSYDGSGLGELALAASTYTTLALASASASHLAIAQGTFGVPWPVLLTAIVGALLSLLFMDPLEGKQRRFLPATVLAFALIGAAITVGLQASKYTKGAFGDIPAPTLALIVSFICHRLIPLLLVDGLGALKARLANWRAPNA